MLTYFGTDLQNSSINQATNAFNAWNVWRTIEIDSCMYLTSGNCEQKIQQLKEQLQEKVPKGEELPGEGRNTELQASRYD